MGADLKIGIIGDFDPNSRTHQPTNEALRHAAAFLEREISISWVPTDAIGERGSSSLEKFSGIVCSPGGGYRSFEGALAGIRFARERGVPFAGTWAGFQHALLEHARNVVGIADAAHQAVSPDSDDPVISALSCSLVGKSESVTLTAGSLAYRAYDGATATEQFLCNYGLSPKYRARIESGGLRITGVDREGEARLLERTDHPFFIGTLFVPQLSSAPGAPHPLFVAFLRAAADVGDR